MITLRFPILAALSLMLAGCINLGGKNDGPAVVHYVLDDSAAAADAAPPLRAYARNLLILDTATSSFYDTTQLVFSRSPATRGYYQFARWTERPGKRFADLMRTRLDRQGIWNVSAAGGYVRGDALLDTELVEFYHDAARQPGHMRLVLRAELVDLKQRTVLGRRLFEQQVALTTHDAAGAAQASNQAARRTLDELVDWLATLQQDAAIPPTP